MASFSMMTLEILMTSPPGAYGGTRAEIAQIPTRPDATVSFAHEYVHFLQMLSSVMGFRLFAELLDLGIKGALVLEGVVDPDVGGEVAPRRILPLLENRADGAGRGTPGISERVVSICDELRCLAGADEYAYAGSKGPWEIDSARVTCGTYSDDFFGYVTPRGSFRPINLGLLAEGMARRVDRWLEANHGFGHVWNGAPIPEAEVYNGIRTVLSQPRFQHNVTTHTLDRVTVIVCALALATPRPDHAVKRMLERLAHGMTAGLLPATVGHELAKVLIHEGLLRAAFYNDVMTELVRGKSFAVMDRQEFYDIYKQLGRIQVAANYALSRPDYFADDQLTWTTVRGWMNTHSVPSVHASDGELADVDGVACGNAALSLLRHIVRVFF